MGSGATNFTGASTKYLLSTEIFPDFIHLYSRGDKMNNFSKPLNKINSIESYTRDMVLKCLLGIISRRWITHALNKI